MRADGPTTVKFWAVAKVAGATPQVAIKFNDLPPVKGQESLRLPSMPSSGKSNTR